MIRVAALQLGPHRSRLAGAATFGEEARQLGLRRGHHDRSDRRHGAGGKVDCVPECRQCVLEPAELVEDPRPQVQRPHRHLPRAGARDGLGRVRLTRIRPAAPDRLGEGHERAAELALAAQALGRLDKGSAHDLADPGAPVGAIAADDLLAQGARRAGLTLLLQRVGALAKGHRERLANVLVGVVGEVAVEPLEDLDRLNRAPERDQAVRPVVDQDRKLGRRLRRFVFVGLRDRGFRELDQGRDRPPPGEERQGRPVGRREPVEGVDERLGRLERRERAVGTLEAREMGPDPRIGDGAERHG